MSQFTNQPQNTQYSELSHKDGKPQHTYNRYYSNNRVGKNGYSNRYSSNFKQRNNYQRRRRYNNDSKRKITTGSDGWSHVSKSRSPKKQEFVAKQQYKKSPINKLNRFSALNDNEEDTVKTVTSKHYNVDVPKVVKTSPVLKGAWSKGITSAIKEEKKFEKKTLVEEENQFSNMTALGSDLNKIVEQVRSFREETAPPTSNWGDIVDSESEYDSDSYSDYEY
jgi:NADH:ubiquinone oxidoreductase subunit